MHLSSAIAVCMDVGRSAVAFSFPGRPEQQPYPYCFIHMHGLLPTKTVPPLFRSAALSIDRERKDVWWYGDDISIDPGGVQLGPSLSLNSLALCAVARVREIHPAGRPASCLAAATSYFCQTLYFTARSICFDATLRPDTTIRDRWAATQSSAGSHIFFSKCELLTLNICGQIINFPVISAMIASSKVN
jgi:hypothetical protein